jgi:hypothetical protein
VDDNSYVFLDALAAHLSTLDSTEPIMLGRCTPADKIKYSSDGPAGQKLCSGSASSSSGLILSAKAMEVFRVAGPQCIASRKRMPQGDSGFVECMREAGVALRDTGDLHSNPPPLMPPKLGEPGSPEQASAQDKLPIVAGSVEGCADMLLLNEFEATTPKTASRSYAGLNGFVHTNRDAWRKAFVAGSIVSYTPVPSGTFDDR